MAGNWKAHQGGFGHCGRASVTDEAARKLHDCAGIELLCLVSEALWIQTDYRLRLGSRMGASTNDFAGIGSARGKYNRLACHALPRPTRSFIFPDARRTDCRRGDRLRHPVGTARWRLPDGDDGPAQALYASWPCKRRFG